MPDIIPFSLEITDPVWKIKLPDGTVKSYDPWETIERLQRIPKDPHGAAFNFDGMREAFGFPTAEKAAADQVFTPSRNVLVELSTNLQEFIDGLPTSKKLAALKK